MVFSCVYPGCFSRAKPLRLRSKKSRGDSPVKFHTFPVNDPECLKLWLIAIRWDVNTPKEKLYRRVLCSEHFSSEDYRERQGKTGKYLKPSAVPVPPSLPATGEDDETDVQGAAAFFEGVPQSTPVKPRNITKTQSQSHSEELDINISMLSLDCPSDKKDTSFVPPSSTSTSTPTSEEDTETEMWKETKWIVNESNMVDLFKRCQEWSLLQVKWECEKGHKGHWNSCADVRGMPLNNLLVSSSVLFTGATYSDIADWAALMNLQVPKKTTYYAVQSSYLIPVVTERNREKF
uniref:THAP-type domain-containing protein n=1 Tax=Sinocyclocheilus anshuiensis TaxID=1608454 RepID=A0A671R2P9_9TELE